MILKTFDCVDVVHWDGIKWYIIKLCNSYNSTANYKVEIRSH